ncbi:MAG: hypothetical protein Q8L54_05225 [Devosia sp.]|nr:hypothetical protein [Devosia sp.]
MSENNEEPVEPPARAKPDTTDHGHLYWRASLGQATFELLAASRMVTVETLIAHLEAEAASNRLVLRTLSTAAALAVLRPLAQKPGESAEPAQ